MHEVSCGILVAWLVQIFRLEATVLCVTFLGVIWADVWRDHATNELYVSEGKE